MSKSTDSKLTPNIPGTNPNVQSQDGKINPSAPTVGTEGWGNTADERRVLSPDMHSGSLDDPGRKREGSEQDNNQADLSRRTSASAHSMNTSHGGNDHTFRCADAGNADCRWETSGSTEDEVMQRAEEHGRREHGLKDWTEAMRNKVKDAIHRREAA